MKKRLFGIRWAVCAVLSLAMGAEAQIAAPINPAFLAWQKRQELKKTGRAATLSLEAEEANFGLTPAPMDLSYLSEINSGAVRKPAEGFASRYDLRTLNRLTPVKDQGNYNTCWAHAALSSMESWLKTSEAATFDFSENNMVNLHGGDKGFDGGGNGNYATAYLTRWGGPVLESADPYPNPGGSTVGTPVRHVQQVRWIPGKTSSLGNDNIKQAVMTYGALSVTYYQSVAYYNSTYKSYYCPSASSVNHAVAVVGWDDNFSKDKFSTVPAGDGAYIVRNSWGESWGEGGYFYVSYYDAALGRDTSYSFSSAESTENYGSVYQYDPLGVVSCIGFSTATAWGANIFTASKADKIAAVGFYATVPNTSYEIYIYTGVTAGSPRSGTLETTQSGTSDYAGFTTVPLDSPIFLFAGQNFSVVLRLTTPEYKYPLALEYAMNGYSSAASASTGQSFYSPSGNSWRDLTAYNSTANFCCKAYTQSSSAVVALSSIAISGGSTSIASDSSCAFTCRATYSDNSHRKVSPSWSISHGSAYASVSSSGEVTAGHVALNKEVTLMAEYSEDGVTAPPATFSITITAAEPLAPTNVVATSGSFASSVRVSWNPAEGADSYAVYRSATTFSANAAYLGLADGVTYFSDTTAVPGKDYTYFVKAKNSSGTSGFSSGAMGYRALSAPTGVTASDGTSQDYVAVSWNASEGASHYCVYRSTSDGGSDFAPVSHWQTARTFNDTTAVAGTTYFYYVFAAMDASGTRASASSVFDVGTRAMPPPPPSLTSLTISGAASVIGGRTCIYSCTAIYSDGSTKPVTPTWFVSGLNGAAISAAGVLSVPSVAANTTVTVSVGYTDGVTKTQSKTVVVAVSPPGVPVGFSASAGTSTAEISLSWMAISDASSYTLWRNTVDDSNSASQIGMSSTNFFGDATATPGVTYYYWVCSVNSASAGAVFSASASGWRRLAAPAGLKASPDGLACVAVSWQPSAGASYYRVSRAETENGVQTDLGDWQTATSYRDTSAEVGAVYYYFIRAAVDSSGSRSSDLSSAVSGSLTTPVSLTGLAIIGPAIVNASAGAIYGCTASYSDGSTKGVSPQWSIVSGGSYATVDANGQVTTLAVTSDQPVTLQASYTDGAVQTQTKSITICAPAAVAVSVSNVSATARRPWNGKLDIAYTVSASPAEIIAAIAVSGYDYDLNQPVVAKTLSGEGATEPVVAGDHSITWDIGADHTNFHAKAFRVKVEATAASLFPPIGVSATQGTYLDRILVYWSGVTCATSYQVWRGTSSSSSEASLLATTASTSYSDTSITPGATYYYWIKAAASYGASDLSASAHGYSLFYPTYVVIDLSGGTSTSSYPVSYLNAVPSGGWTDEYKTMKLALRLIDAGTFLMGSPENELGRAKDGGEQLQQATLAKPFYIGVFELTQKQWQLVMGTTPSEGKGDTLPVEQVSYEDIRCTPDVVGWQTNSLVDAKSFLGVLSAKTGHSFDLPTEAQWEYACRAGTTTALNNGKNLTNEYSDASMAEVGRYAYNQNDGKGGDSYNNTTKVGSYLPNAWGLYDMHGNVMEWCQDWYVKPSETSRGSLLVLRGGSSVKTAGACRSASRSCFNSYIKSNDIGFRPVLIFGM